MADRTSLESRVEEILDHTMGALRRGREQMYGIAETARTEYNRIVASIEELKKEIEHWITEVDHLEREFRRVRRRLYEVSQHYDQYSEQEKKEAYEEADDVRERLTVARERETHLRVRRDDQERALLKVRDLVERTDGLMSQVGVALDFLEGNLQDINEQIEGLRARRQIGKKIIRVQEEERKRVAREIHDGPAQDLANVVLKADICERMLSSDERTAAIAELRELKGMVKDSLKEVRRIIHNLRPMALDDLGLVPTVKRYVSDIRLQQWAQVHTSILGSERRLPSEVEVAVFRTMQEALNNIRRHAEADNVWLRLEYLAEELAVCIEDDGRGFARHQNTASSGPHDHFGLLNMRERVEMLGGTCQVESSLGRGTRVLLRIPLTDTEGGAEHGGRGN